MARRGTVSGEDRRDIARTRRAYYERTGVFGPNLRPRVSNPANPASEEPEKPEARETYPGRLQTRPPTGVPSTGPDDNPGPTRLVTDTEPFVPTETPETDGTVNPQKLALDAGTGEEGSPTPAGDRGSVDIPDDLSTVPWPQVRSIASKLTDQPIRNRDDAERAIEAERKRRKT